MYNNFSTTNQNNSLKNKKPLLITIDGPAGAGKTTIAHTLAKHLSYRYYDTGSLYRAVSYEAIAAGITIDDHSEVEQLCEKIDFKFINSGNGLRLLSNNLDITDKIRTKRITMIASAVSAIPVVRKCLLDFQRDLGLGKKAIFEGRDMGTVVFPNADIKFYLDASCEVRALRRFNQISSSKTQLLHEVENDIKKRDANDTTRMLAPLKPALDAVCIDSTSLAINEVIDTMLLYIIDMWVN